MGKKCSHLEYIEHANNYYLTFYEQVQFLVIVQLKGKKNYFTLVSLESAINFALVTLMFSCSCQSATQKKKSTCSIIICSQCIDI